jgi:hypothetical protein
MYLLNNEEIEKIEENINELNEEIYNLKISLLCVIVAVVMLALLELDLFDD